MENSVAEPIKNLHNEVEVLSYTDRKEGKFSIAIRTVARNLSNYYDKKDENVLPLFSLFQPLEKDKKED